MPFSFLPLLLLLTGAPAPADPFIDHLSAKAAGGGVSVRFSLVNAFRSEETVKALQNGLPTSFTYVIEMYRDRPNWFDGGAGRARIEVIATFNAVTREYLLNYRRDRKLVRSETFSDLESLERRMTTIDEHALFGIGRHKPHKLRVRVKADLRRGWLWYVIPWNFSTRWKVVRVVAENGR
ncbi:MAG TPA: DUF4390 domain-containing protein [Thermoanaerobaculia bacterium]|nr:DUF4390 domain-containing protein [Thermoanaerobaculia bacterium]